MKRVLLALLLLALIVAGLGCDAPGTQREPLGAPFAGTNDVELIYEVVGAPVPEQGFGRDLRALMLARFGAAQIGADVDEDEATGRQPRLRIVVDERLVPRVDELATWTGTLLVMTYAKQVTLSPPPISANLKLVEYSGDPPDAIQERWYEGRRADVLRAIETWSIDREYRILAEPIPEPADGMAVARWRTRVVHTTPIGELGDGAIVGWGGGPSIRIRGDAGSATAKVIHDAFESGATSVLVRGRVSLGEPRASADMLLVDFGAGAGAYARARRERILLATPRLPPLRRVDAVGLPPNRALSMACLIVPVLLSLAWLFFVRRFDRAHPEPMWLIGATFLLGALSTVPAAFVEELLAGSTHWLDPNLVTYGGQAFAFPLSFAVFTVVVGLTEEGAKRLATELAIRRPEFDEPVDGIVYGIVASLGFAAAENIRYFAIGRMNAPLVIARCFMSVPAHMFFGALWGYALGHKLVDAKTRRWAWIALAAGAHGLFDALLSTDGAGILAVVLNLLLASAFVALVRRSLRHGPISEEMRAAAISPEDRALFRVGRPFLFWISATLLHALAFGIFILGAFYQLSRHRPSVLFVVGSTVLLAPLVLAALGVATTLPLDVVIDSYGITFAGAARPWRKIRSYKTVSDHIEVECEGGPLLLGPAPAPMLEGIAEAMRAHLGGAGGGDRVRTLESNR